MSNGDEEALCVENALARIRIVGSAECLLTYEVKGTGRVHAFGPPVFEVDASDYVAALTGVERLGEPVALGNGCAEHRFRGQFAGRSGLALELVVRLPEHNPIARLRFVLSGDTSQALTRASGRDRLTYLGASLRALPHATEVRLSDFVALVHSYCLAEQPVEPRHFEHDLDLMGPILVGSDGHTSLLLAYEHGSQTPDAFVRFQLRGDRSVEVAAVKGNYAHGRTLTPQDPYQSLWLHVGAVAGDETTLAAAYRAFILRHMSLHAASREPYIFYNTWALQERQKWWQGRAYLDAMRQDRVLEEIEIAHRMGVEVFVLDTGWYERTGDWRVNTGRFDEGLRAVKERLDRYDMRLGLWFGPTSAAASSEVLRGHRDCVMSWRGRQEPPRPVWETEESYRMCLVSRYGDAFAEELIRLAREVGVTYFKWDAIGQYGCDAAGHGHGDEQGSPQERADCYAFELVRAMTRIVERLSESCPAAIVDIDVTEPRRSVGLGFLAAGKYFLVNNGPYYSSYDVPVDPATQNTNVFFFPGQARNWVCRASLGLDRWIPSVLFLVHYLPDGPPATQLSSVASLILGHNGVWGDLTGVDDEGVALFARLLGLYKQVRRDMAESSPVRTGTVGGSPEVHEKISARTGRGAVAVFATAPGRYTYVTAARVAPEYRATEGVSVRRDGDGEGRARLEVTFEEPGAAIAFFGVDN